MSAPMRASVGAAAATRDLWEMAERDDSSQLAAIIERGADINCVNAAGVTILMRASERGRVNLVRALIHHGANLNAARSDHFTPLSLAAFFGHANVVKVLVEAGADPGAVTRFETSAEMWAMARSYFDIADYLHLARRQQSTVLTLVEDRHEGRSKPVPVVDPEVTVSAVRELYQPELVKIPAKVVGLAPVIQAPPSMQASDENVSQPEAQAPELRSSQPEVKPVDKTPLVISVKRSAVKQPVQEIDVEGETEHSTPLVIRTLKDPPEIWDLVHETPPLFNPGKAFLTRLTSSTVNLLFALIFVLAASGAGVYALMKFRGRPAPTEAIKTTTKQVQAPVKVVADTAKVSDVPVSKPSEPVQQIVQPGHDAAVLPEQNTVPEPPLISLKRSSSHAAREALTTRSGSASRFTPITESPVVQKEPEVQSFESVSKPVAREVTAPANQPKRSSSTLSPQLIAPSETTTPAKKPKVIQWP